MISLVQKPNVSYICLWITTLFADNKHADE